MLEQHGLIFHGNCISEEIEALHNRVMSKIEQRQYIDSKVTVYDYSKMKLALA